jgi:hypothetical protein
MIKYGPERPYMRLCGRHSGVVLCVRRSISFTPFPVSNRHLSRLTEQHFGSPTLLFQPKRRSARPTYPFQLLSIPIPAIMQFPTTTVLDEIVVAWLPPKSGGDLKRPESLTDGEIAGCEYFGVWNVDPGCMGHQGVDDQCGRWQWAASLARSAPAVGSTPRAFSLKIWGNLSEARATEPS